MTAQAFDLSLPPFVLEAGAPLARHVVRGHWFGDAASDLPIVLIVPALTGDSRAGGAGGFWEPLIGRGLALDPTRYRIVCCDLLGSCHGTSGASDADFPPAAGEHAIPVPPSRDGRRSFTMPWPRLPATVTTWDQARSLSLALDALGIERVHLATGGSLGGMVAMALAASDSRVERVAPLGGTSAASAWLLAWNHVARRILVDAMERGDAETGLSLARQLAMISYRSPSSLAAAQGRSQVQKIAWNPQAPYRVQTWLENHGSRLAARFDARSYYCLLGAMDHHDLQRPSPEGCTLADVRARALIVALEHDSLFVEHDAWQLAEALEALGGTVARDRVHSAHGHDALFLAWDELARVLRRALEL